MTTEWFTSGFDPALLPPDLRLVHDYWLDLTEDGRAPLRVRFNPLALPDALLGNLAIFEISDTPGSGQGRFRLAGSTAIAFHGTDIGSAPLGRLLRERGGDLVDDLGEFFADEDWRLPIFLTIDKPSPMPEANLSLLILPLRRETRQARLVALVYRFDTVGAGPAGQSDT